MGVEAVKGLFKDPFAMCMATAISFVDISLCSKNYCKVNNIWKEKKNRTIDIQPFGCIKMRT